MISTNVYDYINVLDKAADAAWLRNEAIANNIANQDTPGYKRQDVDFESTLKQALQSAKGQSMDEKVKIFAVVAWMLTHIQTMATFLIVLMRTMSTSTQSR